MKNTMTKAAQNGAVKTKGAGADSELTQQFRELFIDELKDIYWAEKALTKAIPKMIKNASAAELVDALGEHLEVTELQVSRLEEVFELLGEKAVGKKCEAITGLTKEADEMMKDTEKGMIRDAGIIMSAQKVEHYEIATYGTLSAYAKILGEHEAAVLLEVTLHEEKDADKLLSEVTGSVITVETMDEEDAMVVEKVSRK